MKNVFLLFIVGFFFVWCVELKSRSETSKNGIEQIRLPAADHFCLIEATCKPYLKDPGLLGIGEDNINAVSEVPLGYVQTVIYRREGAREVLKKVMPSLYGGCGGQWVSGIMLSKKRAAAKTLRQCETETIVYEKQWDKCREGTI